MSDRWPNETATRLRYALQNCVNIMKMCRRNCAEDELVRAYLKDGIYVAETALAAPSPETREVGQ